MDAFSSAPQVDAASESRSFTSAETDEFLAEFCGDADQLPRDLAGIKAREQRRLPIDCASYVYSYHHTHNSIGVTACRLTNQYTRTLNLGIWSFSSVRCDYGGCGQNNIGAARSHNHIY